MSAWVAYAQSAPPDKGVYQWRVPSKSLPGAFVLFIAHMRERGAGYQQVVSPEFGYWDGYRLHVPPGTEWREYSGTTEIKQYEYGDLSLEGASFDDCIYCGKTPRLRAVQRSGDGGCFVGSKPNEYNSWWLECCSWGSTPHLADPREIARVRRDAFVRAATTKATT